MIDKFSTYGGLAEIINSLNSDDDVKLFLVKYRKWYISEKKCSWYDAQYKILSEIQYIFSRFIKNDDIVSKFIKVLNEN